jgi:transposase
LVLGQPRWDNEVQTRCTLAASAATPQEVPGTGVVLAASSWATSVTSPASHFASDTDTAPLDAFSGQQNRHRLNAGGNRQLNSVLHTLAVCQKPRSLGGRDYCLNKTSTAGSATTTARPTTRCWKHRGPTRPWNRPT